jgi:hypothetical protein
MRSWTSRADTLIGTSWDSSIMSTSYILCFSGKFYEQCDRMTMDSPMSPMTVGFSWHLSGQPIHSSAGSITLTPLWYCPMNWRCWRTFLDHLVGAHKNIQFMMELEIDGYLPFPFLPCFDIYTRSDGSWVKDYTRNPPTPTSIWTSAPTTTTTTYPTGRLYFPPWCSGPELFAPRIVFMSWIFSRLLQQLTDSSGSQPTWEECSSMTFNCISRVLSKHNIKSLLPPWRIFSFLWPVNCDLGLKTLGL